jgi:ABC-type dipeptide/oligopeptide/nickel transport system permease subunit
MLEDNGGAILSGALDEALLTPLPKDDADLNRIVRPSLTYWQDAWIKLKKNKVAMLGLAIIVLYVLLAIFAPILSPYDFAAQNAKAMNQWPSASTSSAPTRPGAICGCATGWAPGCPFSSA